MLVLGLSTGHKVGLAVTAFVFILFALGSSFLFPRVRPQYPGRGLPAFIIVAFVFFFGMLSAVEVFGAEPKETKQSEHAADTFVRATTTTAATATTVTTAPATQAQTTTKAATPAAAAKPATIDVTETEFKIVLAPSALKAGKVTFQIKNTGKLPHDLAIVGGPRSKLIAPGGTGTLTTILKAGKVELYCSVPGHKQAGMNVKTTVAQGQAAATTPAAPAAATPSSVKVTETEFKIVLAPPELKTGRVTFEIKNTGKLPHDLAIVGGPKSKLIAPGGTGTLSTILKAGKVELYCSVPGHKQAGMDVKTTVS
ncbi:MAG: hypothetical protein E6G13_08310 [Actinobacteria bacterium]|nr:MAG: hypothetical protein E6G13_08310 [Actinomycetota bacterium]